MKKTFTISISGTVFHIEEDAFEKLQGYLFKLKNHFGNDDEGREIVADIEARIADLFLEKSKGESKVVVNEWIDDVIATMGTPEDFESQEAGGEPVAGQAKRRKRLYRDTEHRVFGGVSSGLGAYFNIDPVVVRIIFVVLLLMNGIGVLAYLVLWIAVPKAETTSQRLEMRGQEVTVSNIERTIRDDIRESKEAHVKPTEKSAPLKQAEKSSGSRGGGTNVIKDILQATLIAFGIFMILTGLFGLVGMISTMMIGQSLASNWPLAWDGFMVSDMLNFFVSPGTMIWGLIMIGLLAGIPLLAILYIGTKLVFRYKSNNTAIGLGMAGVWLIALLALMIISFKEVSNFKNRTSLTSTETLAPPEGKTLYLRPAPDRYENYSKSDWDIERFKTVLVDGKPVLLGEPRLDIEKSLTGECVILIKKWARGKTQAEANEHIQSILYNYHLSDSILTFDPWFLPGKEARWHDQRVEITLKLPENMSVHLGEGMERLIYDIDNVTHTWDGEMIGKTWVMKPEGLTMKDSIR